MSLRLTEVNVFPREADRYNVFSLRLSLSLNDYERILFNISGIFLISNDLVVIIRY